MTLEQAINDLDGERNCTYAKWLNNQNQQLIAEISQAFARDTQPYKIYRALTKMGLKCANSTFYRHNKGECICFSK